VKVAFYVAFAIHLVAILGILALLVISWKKSPRALNPGVLHATATALLAGIVMVFTWSGGHDTEINHMKVGIKFLIVLALLVIGFVNLKKKTFTDRTFTVMLGLTIANILIAYGWR
jgi:uncharacterized membrane protein